MPFRIPVAVLTVALCLDVSTQPANAQFAEIHSEHFLFGYPTGMPASNDLIIRDLYALSSNDQTKLADWVAYRLTAAEVMGSLDLERDFRTDPFLEANETLEASPSSQDDYRGANAAEDYDRGHLAPLASFKGSRMASQVNYYSNIAPQVDDLNQGPWQRLEQAARDIVCAGTVLWVMTGPLYDGTPAAAALPNADEAHTVPTGFWKILATDGLASLAAFIFEQDTPRNDDVADHLVRVNDIEQRSGLDFFRKIGDPQEDALEDAVLTAADWNGFVPVQGCTLIRP